MTKDNRLLIAQITESKSEFAKFDDTKGFVGIKFSKDDKVAILAYSDVNNQDMCNIILEVCTALGISKVELLRNLTDCLLED